MRQFLCAFLMILSAATMAFADADFDKKASKVVWPPPVSLSTQAALTDLNDDNSFWLNGPGTGPLPAQTSIEAAIMTKVYGCKTRDSDPTAIWCKVGVRNRIAQMVLVDDHGINVQLMTKGAKKQAKLAGLKLGKRNNRKANCAGPIQWFEQDTQMHYLEQTCVIGRFVYVIHFNMKLVDDGMNS